jgi:rare lipoprotein A
MGAASVTSLPLFGRNSLRVAAIAALVLPLLAACGGGGGGGVGSSGVKRAAFSSAEFGVAVSPRVTREKYPPRGGGRYLSPRPYVVRGVTYQPVEGPGYVARGKASWYGQDFHGRRTANGEIFGAFYLTAASPVLPVPSYARVTNLENGRSILVRINDRGPYLKGRIIDLSYEAASILGYVNNGSAEVEVRYVGPAALTGDDTRMLRASVNKLTKYEREQQVLYAMTEDTAPVPVERGRMNLADYNADGRASRGDRSGGGLLGEISGLFGYAESGPLNDADAAAQALASGETQTSPEAGDRGIRLELGTFADFETAVRMAQSFAVLGAVDEEYLDTGTRLTLVHLKPGVARDDVLLLARELGLKDPILY